MRRFICLCLPLFFFSSVVLSAAPDVIGVNSAEPLSAANLTQWTIGLIFILLIIFIAAWAGKRFTGLTTSHKGDLKILSGLSLGSREKAVLIKAGNQHLLLGVAPGRVVTLHTFERGAIPEETQNEQSPQLFQESLKKVMNKQGVE